MYSDLYKKDRYLNTDIDYLVGYEIIEYDMRDAGFNISKQFNLLSEYEIKQLTDLPKQQRKVQLGLLQKYRESFKKSLKQGFIDARKLLFMNNELRDIDILSIKKDAIFVTRRCPHTSFGHIQFASKNQYTSYYRINKVEFFYNSSNDTLDIKNIGDDLLELHNDGMILFFKEFFRLKELTTDKRAIEFLKEFIQEYKLFNLPSEFYREFNQNSLFKLNMVHGDKNIYLDDTDINIREEVDIKYNYLNYLLPLVRMMI